MKALEGKKIGYQQGIFELKNVSLSIKAGEITGIVGPNGSGKSTLLKLFARLNKVKTGQITLKGESIYKKSRKDFSKQLAMLLQSKEALPTITVQEFVAYGRSPYQKRYGTISTEDKGIIAWAIKECQLVGLENRMINSLSGGELQRARIAMALAQKTTILLLDEPTTYLDIAHAFEIMELMKKINKKYGITIVMVLHELHYAGAYCDQLIVMKKGQVYSTGKPVEILSSKLLKDVYGLDAMILYKNEFPLIIPNKREIEEE